MRRHSLTAVAVLVLLALASVLLAANLPFHGNKSSKVRMGIRASMF